MSETKTPGVPVDCEAVVRSLWDFLDAELDDEALASIRGHLEACAPCCGHVDFEKRLLEELATMRRQNSDPEALRARIELAISNAKAEG